MKIQGSNPLFNSYNKQLQQKDTIKKKTLPSDRIDISKEALKLQDNKELQNSERAKKVEVIKEKVETNQYKIDFDATAIKMMKVWSNQSY